LETDSKLTKEKKIGYALFLEHFWRGEIVFSGICKYELKMIFILVNLGVSGGI